AGPPAATGGSARPASPPPPAWASPPARCTRSPSAGPPSRSAGPPTTGGAPGRTPISPSTWTPPSPRSRPDSRLRFSARNSRRSPPPWIDHVHAGFQEVPDVARGEGRTAGTADGSDLGVEAPDRQPGLVAVPRDQRIADRGASVKRQHVVAERGETLIRRRQQAILPAPARKACQAVADLGDRDRRRVQLARGPRAHPATDRRGRRRPHQLG